MLLPRRCGSRCRGATPCPCGDAMSVQTSQNRAMPVQARFPEPQRSRTTRSLRSVMVAAVAVIAVVLVARRSVVGVLVFAPGPRLLWRRLRRAVQQEVVVRGDERIGCRDRVRVVGAPVLADEGDEARVLAQAV